jgi:AAA family ATP:ADP antiporter
VEGTWKSYLKEAFPKAADYQSFSSEVTFWTGVFALIISLFFSGGILRKFGWKIAARVAPTTIGIMGCLFFLMSYGKNSVPCLTNWLGPKLVLYIVIFGGIQNLAAKAVKYAFYDKTTQIAYIPLDPEAKIKGKAAVDMLGSRLGKAGSSWIQIALLELFHTNSIQPLSGILFVFLLITTILWYRATDNIDKQLTILEAKESSRT